MEMTVDKALMMALDYIKSTKLVKAKSILEQLTIQKPNNATAIHYLGLCFYQMHDKNKGEQLMLKSLALAPNNSDFLHNLGSLYNQEFRYKKALGYLEKAVSLSPENAIFIGNLTRTYQMLGLEDKAIASGLKCLTLKDIQSTNNFNKKFKNNIKLMNKEIPQGYQDKDINIIAFSLWGDNPLYTHGAIINAMLTPYIYPEWQALFYVDKTVPIAVLKKLEYYGAQIRMLEEPKQSYARLLWRFLISDNEKVTRFICRDTDSRLNIQEKIAVDEWVNSGKAFHIMRDSLGQCELILAGLWGGVAGVLPKMADLLTSFENTHHEKWLDQNFTRQLLWPLIKDHALMHDAYYPFYHAIKFSSVGKRPSNTHVGAIESWDLSRVAL